MPPLQVERIRDWRKLDPTDCRWAALLERAACYYFPYATGWEKQAAALWAKHGQRAALDGRSLGRPLARGSAVLFLTHLKPQKTAPPAAPEPSRFRRRVSGSRRLKPAARRPQPKPKPKPRREWANPKHVVAHKNAARLHVSVGQIMFLDTAGPGPLTPAKSFLDAAADDILGGACLATDPPPALVPPGIFEEDGAAALGTAAVAACTTPAGTLTLHVPLGSRPLFPAGSLVVIECDQRRQMALCASPPAWHPRPSQVNAGAKTLQMRLKTPLEHKVPAGATVRTAGRPPVLWDPTTPAQRLEALTNVPWRTGIPETQKKAPSGASVSDFVQQLRDQHDQDKADVTAADDASKCIGAPWQHTVYAPVRALLASRRPAATALLALARQPDPGPAAVLWPGIPRQSPPVLIVDAGSLTASFYNKAHRTLLNAARDRIADPEFPQTPGEEDAAAHIKKRLRDDAEAARLKLDAIVLPHCVRAVLPGGDMHTRCSADSSLHLKNAERLTAAVVLGAALPTVAVADIEDMLGPAIGEHGKTEFRSLWQYGRRSLRKNKAGGLFSCRKLTGGSAGPFRLCPFADDPVGAFEACTGCRTAPADYNKNPLGALIALSTEAAPKRARLANAPGPAAL